MRPLCRADLSNINKVTLHQVTETKVREPAVDYFGNHFFHPKFSSFHLVLSITISQAAFIVDFSTFVARISIVCTSEWQFYGSEGERNINPEETYI